MENKKKSNYKGYTQAQNKATQKYIKAAYDEIKLRLPKGSKDKIKQYIENQGDTLPENAKSMQGFIKLAIDEKMERDTAEKE